MADAGLLPGMPSVPPDWQDLSPGKRDVLLALALDGVASTPELAAELDRHTRSWIFRCLEGLEGDGLVTGRDRDGRTREWDLTDDGAALVDRFRAGVA